MANENLVEKKNVGWFSKIKNWFSNLFSIGTTSVENTSELELETQESNNENNEIYQENQGAQEKLKYEFSKPTVSKQKIEKVKKELDSDKIGIEKLYQLSSEELDELEKLYDGQIDDVISKLNEIEVSLNNYRRRLDKVQNQ